jgi:hypothetical protein
MRYHRRPGSVTVKDLEACLDILAEMIAAAGDDAELLFPLWDRCEREIGKLKEAERIRSAAKERLERNHRG